MDALAQVFVKMTYQGVETSGRGLDQDVLEASAKAYLKRGKSCHYHEENLKKK